MQAVKYLKFMSYQISLTLADSKSNEVISKELGRFLVDGEEEQMISGVKPQWKTGKNPDIFRGFTQRMPGR